MEHNYISVVISAPQSRRRNIESELDKLKNPANDLIRKAFRKSKTIHFMSAALVSGDGGQRDFLVLEMSVDGSVKNALELFDDNEENGVSELFDPLFNAAGHTGKNEKAALLKANLVKTGVGYFDVPGLNFSGSPGMSVDRINKDYRLARGIREYFDIQQPSGPALKILEKLREDFKSDPHFTESKNDRPALNTLIPAGGAPKVEVKRRKATDPRVILKIAFATIMKLMWPMLILAVAATYLTLPAIETSFLWLWSLAWRFTLWSLGFLALSILIFLVLLLRRERQETGDLSVPNPKQLSEARAREDIGQVQNHLFGVSKIKPGILRKISLRLTFLIIGQLAKRSFRPGYLSEIGTIHFARWFQIPGTDKLIFCSNYGGSWESYLEDFIYKATKGLTGVWSNTFGFPKARLLFSETQADIFLSYFGSMARPHNDVERDEIQSLLFKGHGSHNQSACMLLRLPEQPSDAKTWLKTRLNSIGFDSAATHTRIDQIAFSASGLTKLGLNADTLSQFSYPFLQGMDHPERSRVLADTGEDKPELWQWGHAGEKDRSVDCAYMVYIEDGGNSAATTKKTLSLYCKDLEKTLAPFGGKVVDCIITSHFQDRKDKVNLGLPSGNSHLPREPFGFVDGISQPIIKGLRRGAPSAETALHHVEPGEFILGYPDNRGTQTLSPSLEAKYDPQNILPDYKLMPKKTEPQSIKEAVSGLRDLARNGSYLVIRQLDQHVESFNAFLERAAKDHKGHAGIPKGYSHAQIREFLAAKILGRWKDGTSLIKYPYEPGTGWDGKKPERPPDNDFLLGREDPVGLSCPFGSHVRRTNPRDSFEPHDEAQLEIVNRHRILRRGRFYHDTKTKKQGLLFMCFNADIERQFEFIQQTWCQARQFMGLDNEVDPILGRGGVMGRVTIPTEQGPIFLKGSPDAVTVIGGGYFFMPSKSALHYLSAMQFTGNENEIEELQQQGQVLNS